MTVNSRTKHRDNYKRFYENFDDKTRRYIHDPFHLEMEKLEVACDKDGRVTIKINHNEDEYEEVNVPASLIFKIAMMLEMTRSIVYVDKKE